jgi:hypothetical protein
VGYGSDKEYMFPDVKPFFNESGLPYEQLCCALKEKDSSVAGGREFDYQALSNAVSPHTLASLIQDIYTPTPEAKEANIVLWQSNVAPPDMIRSDFDFCLNERNRLLWGGAAHARDLLVRAIPGHATSGHCHFKNCGSIYPNTMSIDVVNALEEYPYQYRMGSFEDYAERTQNEINQIVYFFEDFFSNPKETHRITKGRDGTYLGNLKILKKNNFRLNMLQGAQGFYFCSYMDSYDPIRIGVKEKYGFEMGGGRTYAADINRLKELNIGLREFASMDYQIPFFNHLSYENLISVFIHLGIIYEPEVNMESMDDVTWDKILKAGVDPREYPDKDIRKVYIRQARGSGVADDLAICNAGFIPNVHTVQDPYADEFTIFSRVISGFLADKIDTLEKDSQIILPGGQDETAGKYINELFRRACTKDSFRELFGIVSEDADLVPRELLIDYTAASAIRGLSIHSSQRYFLRKQYTEPNNKGRATCTIKELMRLVHMNAERRQFSMPPFFKDTNNIPDIYVGFDRVPLKDVASDLSSRLTAIVGCDNHNILKNPNKRERNVSRILQGS